MNESAFPNMDRLPRHTRVLLLPETLRAFAALVQNHASDMAAAYMLLAADEIDQLRECNSAYRSETKIRETALAETKERRAAYMRQHRQKKKIASFWLANKKIVLEAQHEYYLETKKRIRESQT